MYHIVCFGSAIGGSTFLRRGCGVGGLRGGGFTLGSFQAVTVVTSKRLGFSRRVGANRSFSAVRPLRGTKKKTRRPPSRSVPTTFCCSFTKSCSLYPLNRSYRNFARCACTGCGSSGSFLFHRRTAPMLNVSAL